MNRLALSLIIIAGLLTACGNTSNPTDDSTSLPATATTVTETAATDAPATATIVTESAPTDVPSDDEEPENGTFNAEVSGVIESTISGSGYFQCDTVNGGELNIAPDVSLSDTVLLSLPRNIAPGEYRIVAPDTQPDTISAEYYGEDIMTEVFDQNVRGTLQLEVIASTGNEPVAGTFEFRAENENGEQVSVTGEFDFEAGEDSFFSCS
jgi:hypothetical protein